MSDALPRAIARFVALALCLFGLLMLPWPGFARWYAYGFRGLVRLGFVGEADLRQVEMPGEQPQEGMTKITVLNRALLSRDGSGPVRNLNLPNTAFWGGSALFLALALATPRPWRVRISFAVAGFVLVQLFFWAVVSFAIWNEGHALELGHLSSGWQSRADRLQAVLVEQGALAVPVLAWLATLWRFEKAEAAPDGSGGNPARPQPAPRSSRKASRR